ncbi:MULTISPECIES: type II secretion system minor pseudopilin GspI [Pseudomonas]|uniref:type II secretion system minor pseudopilin GspI n=1 Tax=Pseudomonas TaxID=286 RepID=UPI001E2E02C0|nr:MULTISPECIES: type II secretion system minor pseudopilin GspI [Pseudomonas]MCE1117228.1 type II secretion system minor pseudopilin GspI [Pseudomonas sp. NMI795_08]
MRARRQRGFTLIEVLVALAIVAVAMAAAVRVAGLMTQGNGLLRDRSLALLAAQNRLAELRLGSPLQAGLQRFACDQGRLRLRCEQTVGNGPRDGLWRVQVQVFDSSRDVPALANLESWIAPLRKGQPL